MTRSIHILLATAALLWLVSLVAAPVALQVDSTTGEVLSPLVADATSNKTIAVFEIPMGGPLPFYDFQTSGFISSGEYARDFELKIYRQATAADQTSVLLADKVYWYHSPNNTHPDQVLPNGLPDGYFLGGDDLGGPDGSNKTLFKIRHAAMPSISAHRNADFIFSGAVIYVETAGTAFERMKNCHAMYTRYSAGEAEALDDSVEGRRWWPIEPSSWVSELPAFLQ